MNPILQLYPKDKIEALNPYLGNSSITIIDGNNKKIVIKRKPIVLKVPICQKINENERPTKLMDSNQFDPRRGSVLKQTIQQKNFYEFIKKNEYYALFGGKISLFTGSSKSKKENSTNYPLKLQNQILSFKLTKTPSKHRAVAITYKSIADYNAKYKNDYGSTYILETRTI